MKLTLKEANRLALKIPAELRALESGLMRSRWWDYKAEPLHPTSATYLFADFYIAHHRNWWACYIDARTAEYARPWKSGDVFDEPVLSSIWAGRQLADRHGLPYSFVMEVAHGRALKQEFRHPLRPNQLYTEEFEIDLLAAWEDRTRERLVLADSEFYRVDRFNGSQVQKDYRAWMIDQVNKRPKPLAGILARLLVERRICSAMLQAHWPDEAAAAERKALLLAG